jgi:asparagine synthase (glutamine-hydrolysing)
MTKLSPTALHSSVQSAITDDTCLSSFGPRTVDVELRDCRLLVDGNLGTARRGRQDSTSSEVITAQEIINRYHVVGEAFLSDLKGGFRLALWDRTKQKLLVAVDPFGTKPVYYCENSEHFAFAAKLSELSKLASIDRQIDPNVLFFYLNHSFVPAPFSVYRGIRRLEPGQYLIWHNQSLEVNSYWDLDYNEDFTMTEQSAAEQVYAGVEQALKFYVHDYRQSDQVGAFLSGGTDSSTLVGLLSKMQSSPVKTFSVGFTEQAYNEIDYARLAARYFAAEPHECFVSADDALKAMPILAAGFDEPFGNSSAIPTYFCLRAAKEAGITMMLAGDGGDEIFAGNERYLGERLFSAFDGLPIPLQKLSLALGQLLPRGVFPLGKIRRYLERASEPNPARFFYYQLFLSQNAPQYFTPDFLAQIDPEFALTPPRSRYHSVSTAAPLNRLLYMDLKMCIADNDLFKVNRMAETLDIGVQYPYLDRDLAELTGRIPAKFKLKGAEKRYIFKRAFQHLLPQEILKKTKHGFGLPVAGWIRCHPRFQDLARSLLLDRASVERGYFNRAALEALFSKHEASKSDFYGTYIWYFMMLELWHRHHLVR